MYLITQLWTYLAVAFLLGALAGYALWSYCHGRSSSAAGTAAGKGLGTAAITAGGAAAAAEIAQLTKAHADEIKTMKAKTEALLAEERTKHEAALAGLRRSGDEALLKQADELKSIAAKADQKAQGMISAGTKKLEAETAGLRNTAETSKGKAAAAAGDVAAAAAAGAAAKSGSAAKSDAAPARRGKPGEPERLSAPRGGAADDLKLIWGVGAGLEKKLNDLGFWHFDQIANWSSADEAWAIDELGNAGSRIVRDKWIEQCKKLAAGWRPDHEAGDRPH